MTATQRDRVKRMLTEAGPSGVTSRAFYEAGIFRYSARIEELRKDGLEIQTERLKGSLFRYVLEPAGLDSGSRGGNPSTAPSSPPQKQEQAAVEPSGLFAVEDEPVPSTRYLDADADWSDAA